MAVEGYKVKVEGAKAIQDKLKVVRLSAARRINIAASKKAAKPMLALMKSTAPKQTGLLKKSLGVKVVDYRGGAVAVSILGARSGFGGMKKVKRALPARMLAKAAATASRGRPKKAVIFQQKRDATKYLHLVELGRKAVKPKKRKVLADPGGIIGARAAKVTGRRFMLAAYNAKKATYDEIYARELWAGIVKEVGRGKAVV